MNELTAEDWNKLRFYLYEGQSTLTSQSIWSNVSIEKRISYDNPYTSTENVIKSKFSILALDKYFNIPFSEIPVLINSGEWMRKSVFKFRLVRGF